MELEYGLFMNTTLWVEILSNFLQIDSFIILNVVLTMVGSQNRVAQKGRIRTFAEIEHESALIEHKKVQLLN